MRWSLVLLLPGCTWVGDADWEGRRDWDGDGVVAQAFGGLDCDDSAAAIRPGSQEIWYDGVDQNCDGANDYDQDGDGVDAAEFGGSDCDDTDADVYPGAREICDGVDTNCDGALLSDEIDGDGDGWSLCAGDCDDTDELVSPDQPEVCDGAGRDEDCDGLVDDRDDSVSDAVIWYRDADRDGFGESTTRKSSCVKPPGYLSLDDFGEGDFLGEPFDCDDRNEAVFPGAAEVCDGLDTDCDGVLPEAEIEDVDGDGFSTCEDCAPDDPAVYPGAPEFCDGLQTGCPEGGWDDDYGLLSFQGEDGGWTAIEGGSPGASRQVLLDQPGALHVCEGEHYVNLSVQSSLSIRARGDGEAALDGGGLAPVIEIVAPGVEVALSGVTLSGGFGLPVEAAGDVFLAGGGLLCAASGASVLASDLRIERNTSELGGGVALVNGCAATLDALEIAYNIAEFGGGIFVQSAALALSDSTFEGNIASFGGGVAAIEAGLTVEGGLFDGNVATANGGGVYATESQVALLDVVLEENVATRGGAVNAERTGLQVSGGFIRNNAATESGGGLYVFDGDSALIGASVTTNRALSGGGIWADWSAGLLFTDSLFSSNEPDDLLKDVSSYRWSGPVSRICPPNSGACE